MKSYFPHYHEVNKSYVAINERLSWPKTILLSLQHLIAMFGATILAPIIMGFDPNLAILMSGIGTLIFFIMVQGRVPSYLGSSFAFIAGVIAVTNYSGNGPNPNISLALGGIIIAGAIYTAFGILFVIFFKNKKSEKFINRLMPPVVTGTIVTIIGLNLAPIAVKNAMGTSSFEAFMALFTMLLISAVAIALKGIWQKLLILVGLLLSISFYFLLANIFHLGKPIDFTKISDSAWFGLPHFITPVFDLNAISILAPVSIILVAENLGHIKAIGAMTNTDLDRYLGRAFIGDGLATMLSAFFGGTGVTTYAENIGVMALTRVFSSIIFVISALFAIFLGFCPKFGALIQIIPSPILGGIAVVVFGLIAIAGIKIWIDNKVDFAKTGNLLIASIPLILGAGDFSITIGNFSLGGIGTATFGAILLAIIFNKPKDQIK